MGEPYRACNVVSRMDLSQVEITSGGSLNARSTQEHVLQLHQCELSPG